jgi:hypothetical protein
MVVSSTRVRMFLGGVKQVDWDMGDMTGMDTISIETMSGSYYVDAFEVTDEALYEANFTPPDSPPPTSSGAPEYVDVPAGAIVLTGFPPHLDGHLASPGLISLTGHAPSWGPMSAEVPCGAFSLTARAPSKAWSIARAVTTAQVIYYCILTGAADGLDDLYLPMSSFQARMRDGDPSYLSCIFPNSAAYEDAISLRGSGQIIIQRGFRMSDGTEQMEEIIRVNYESLRIDRGARNDSGTITGYRTISSGEPKEVTVTGVSYYGMQADGKRKVRADLDLFLRVGDTCIYGEDGNDYFKVGLITYIVSADPVQTIMEATEA